MVTASSITVSERLLTSLTSAAATGLAQRFLRDLHRSHARGDADPVIHPGDDFGRVVAGLWELNHEGTMEFLAGYMAQVRVHQPDPLPITLSAVLDGLVRFAWPPWADDADAEALRSLALTRVPAYYGDDTTLV